MKETVTGIDKLWKDYNDLHQAELLIDEVVLPSDPAERLTFPTISKEHEALVQAEEIIVQLKTKIWHEINQQLKEKDNGID